MKWEILKRKVSARVNSSLNWAHLLAGEKSLFSSEFICFPSNNTEQTFHFKNWTAEIQDFKKSKFPQNSESLEIFSALCMIIDICIIFLLFCDLVYLSSNCLSLRNGIYRLRSYFFCSSNMRLMLLVLHIDEPYFADEALQFLLAL